MLKLYNTLTKQLEEIKKDPLRNHLNMYTCGPTVYNYVHIGNLRSFILADLLYRTLKADAYNPRWVINITDIDDKTIKGTIEKFGDQSNVQDLHKFTEEFNQAFKQDLREVNVLADEIEFIRVTDKMAEIQEFITELLKKGYAYKAEDGSVYFNIEKYTKDFSDYGQLVGEKFLEGKKVGARVIFDEYEKDNLSDFALWKAHTSEDANIYWDHSELGKGRPGWHIECSVINQVAFNGEQTDIHTGGVDLVFPHHTNEIAQSQALLGKGHFVRHWFHSEHLLVEGKKMSKSEGNFYRLADIKNKGFSGTDFRYSLLSSGYRNQQNFTWENLEAAHNALVKLSAFTAPDEKFGEDVLTAMNSDLNTSQALASLWKQFSHGHLDDILGILIPKIYTSPIPENIHTLSTERQKAKKRKDFFASDELRKQIEDLGYEVMDTPEGQKVKKKIQI